MKTIKLKDLRNLIQDYCNQEVFAKPLMLWFGSNPTIDRVKRELRDDEMISTITFGGHPMDGHEWCFIDGQRAKVKDHPELLSNDILPSGFSDKTKRLLYHNYLLQLKQSSLEYCKYLCSWQNMPIVCLVNDYSANKKDSVNSDFLNKNFEQYFVLERTYDEWKEWATQTKEIVPELIEYMDAHKDLFMTSPALAGMPTEAIHTIESALLLTSYAMKNNEEDTLDEKIKYVMCLIFGQGGAIPDNYFAEREDFKQMLTDYFSK